MMNWMNLLYASDDIIHKLVFECLMACCNVWAIMFSMSESANPFYELILSGVHCPRAGLGQGQLIFADPGPDPQGQGRVRAGPGLTLGPAIFR